MQVQPTDKAKIKPPVPVRGGPVERVKGNNPSPYKKQPDPRVPPAKKSQPSPVLGGSKPLIS